MKSEQLSMDNQRADLAQQPAGSGRPDPVSGRERVEIVDILRGFAIFGILLVNIYSFAGLKAAWKNELAFRVETIVIAMGAAEDADSVERPCYAGKRAIFGDE